MKIILLLIPIMLFALEGKVINISDGDTITILTKDKEQIKIRLFGIDAPEKKQAFGNKSKQYLSNLVAGRIVNIKSKGKDKYKRTIGIVYLNGQDINAKMISAGYAWAFVKYSDKYINEELIAKNKKLGLWQDKEPIPPWEFRKNKK